MKTSIAPEVGQVEWAGWAALPWAHKPKLSGYQWVGHLYPSFFNDIEFT